MRIVELLALCVAAGLLAAGCGGSDEGLPDGALAQVGDATITRVDLDRSVRLASSRAGRASGDARTRAMEALIRDEWFRQEANKRHITVSDAEVQEALDEAQATGFLRREALERAGLSEAQILPTIRKGLLHRKVTAAITAEADDVTPGAVADYYRQNKSELVVAERRDVRLVLTKSRERAAAARAALEEGRRWASVADEYSVHEESRQKGGKVDDVRRGPLDTGITAAFFRVNRGELTGPVRIDRSWAVFTVERIKPAFQATLEQARDEIRGLLASRRRQAALAAFMREYRAETTCAVEYRVRGCSNGPSSGEPGA